MTSKAKAEITKKDLLDCIDRLKTLKVAIKKYKDFDIESSLKFGVDEVNNLDAYLDMSQEQFDNYLKLKFEYANSMSNEFKNSFLDWYDNIGYDKVFGYKVADEIRMIEKFIISNCGRFIGVSFTAEQLQISFNSSKEFIDLILKVDAKELKKIII